jgi:hypothetical protein
MLFSKAKNPKMEEIRNFISVSSSAEFNTIAPHILNAERDYLIPVIGQLTYDELQEFYDAEITGTGSGVQEETAQLLALCQSAVIQLAYWIGFDLINIYLSDSGFKRTESDGVKGIYKYQEENLKNYFRTNGLNALDTVLQYLELHLADFGEFKLSPAYTVFKSAFIPKTEIFDSIVNISKSRLTFLRMKPHMQFIEDTEIVPILGSATYAYLKAEMVKDSPAVKVTALLPYLRKPIAFLASAMLMEESGADLLDNGLYFTSTIASNGNDIEKKPAAADRIAILVMRNLSFGNAYLDQLRSYLTANAADWSDVISSTGKILRRDNAGKKTFFAG